MALSKITNLSITDDAVRTVGIQDNNVTLAKLGDGTQGDILYYGASGAPARLGFGTSGDFLKTQGTGANPVWATAGGITHSSQWRLTTGAAGDLEPIASNWEVNDTLGYSSLGADMTESSGIFTFPVTGYWLITFIINWYYNGDSRWMEADIRTTINDSSYGNMSEAYMWVSQMSGGVTYSQAVAQNTFDVTDTSQCKVQFRSRVDDNSVTTAGSDLMQLTGVTFTRLADT